MNETNRDDPGGGCGEGHENECGPGGGAGETGGRGEHEHHDRQEREEPLGCRDVDRSLRGTGESECHSLAERACSENAAEAFGLNELRSRDSSENLACHELPTRDTLLSDLTCSGYGGEPPQPGERCSAWSGTDSLAGTIAQNACKVREGVGDAVQFIGDFISGAGDLASNYVEMRNRNVKGADKYFHFKGHCEATQRGPGGELASEIIGQGREIVDSIRNVLPTSVGGNGMTHQASKDDINGDLRVNELGRETGRAGTRCYDASQRYRPRGL